MHCSCILYYSWSLSAYEQNKLKSDTLLLLFHLPTAPIVNNKNIATTPPTFTGIHVLSVNRFQSRHFRMECQRRNPFCKCLGAVVILFMVLFSCLELGALFLLLLPLMSFYIVHAFYIIHSRCQHEQDKLRSDTFLLLFHLPSYLIINNNIFATTPPTFTGTNV